MDRLFEISLLALLVFFMATPFLQNLVRDYLRKPKKGDQS